MSLRIGDSVGTYEIVALLGAGGMGEVYRARDTRLGRDVAIKVLRGSWAPDISAAPDSTPRGARTNDDRLVRFEREAHLLAALNHPNIATIHGIETHAGQLALILELVEGPTLAELIAGQASADAADRRGLPLPDAFAIARQIALALAAAHEAGIVHRDLKPANIKIRPDGTVKVLDFGLAKALAVDATSAGDAANSPTMTSPAMTAMGMLLGTAAYMAPEQARGRPIDKRADVWAFGCVLFEMLTGQPTFAGESVTDTLAAVVRGEPDWTTLPADTPESIRRLLRRCLKKERRDRLSDVDVARLEIDDASEPVPTTGAPSRRPSRLMMGGTALAVAALVVTVPLAVRHLREVPTPPPVVRLPITAPDGTRLTSWATVVSPDGRMVAFHAALPDRLPRLWVRSVDSLAAREIPDTEAVGRPFWSPDSRTIAFPSGDRLRTVDVISGVARTLPGAMADTSTVGAWSHDGTIVYTSRDGLWRVSPKEGGADVTKLGEGPHGFPAFLPDGRRFLYTIDSGGTAGAGDVYLASLDAAGRTRVLENATMAAYAPSGHLLFTRDGALLTQRFDAARGVVSGDAMPVAAGGINTFSVSSTGTIVYRPGAVPIGGTPVWVDREGREAPVPGLHMEQVRYARLSPDGRRLALVERGDLWVHDLTGRPPIRLTFNGDTEPAFSPLWTPDGLSIVYEREGRTRTEDGLWQLPADGSVSTPTPVSAANHYHPLDWSADGRELLVADLTSGMTDIVGLPYGTSGAARPVVATPAAEGSSGASLSPDGRWLAYTANPTGTVEVWVRPYPGPGPVVRVSPSTGHDPVWSHDGRSLFYREGDRVLSVSVDTTAGFDYRPPSVLFSGPYVRGGQAPTYAVAADGRFLMLKSPAGNDRGTQPIVVVFNWAAELTE